MPHQWLLMGVQACRLPALKLTPLLLGGPAYRSPGVTHFKPIRQLTGTEGHINGFFRASKPAVCQPLNPSCRCPKATSLKHSLGMLHPAANRHPKATHQWLLMGVQACRLPALKRLKPLKRLKTIKTPNRAGNSAAPRPHRLNILLACFILQPTGTPMPHQWLLVGVQACRLPALKLTPLLLGGPAYRSPGVTRFKPIRQLTGTEGHINGFFRASKPAICQPLNPSCRCPKATSLKHSLGMLHPAANRHPKATHQWLLMGVQACRLPALKRLKPLKPFKRLKPSKSLKPLLPALKPFLPLPQGHTSLKHSLGMLHPAANRHPRATHQWLLMGVQACRLPALKRLKPLKRLKTLKILKILKTLKTLQPSANRHRRPHQWLRPSLPFASP